MQSSEFVEHSSTQVASWASAHFGGVQLGHRQRTQRAVTIASAMAARPGRPIPQLFDDTYAIKATYTLFDDPRSTLDALQRTHRELVARTAAACELVLAFEDTTDVSFSGGSRRPGLGSIGRGGPNQQGFWLHSVLLVDCPRGRVLDASGEPVAVRVLGLADQQAGVRSWPTTKARGPRPTTARLGTKRETQMWERSIARMGPAPSSTRRQRVADRGADIYEYLTACGQSGDGFIVRASHNRVLIDGREPGHLLERARSLAAQGEFAIEMRARPGQPAREAVVSVSFDRVRLRAPQRRGGRPGTLAPIECSIVRVWEAEAPEGVDALEWVLLTDEGIDGFDGAREVAARYAKRWLIEIVQTQMTKTGLLAA